MSDSESTGSANRDLLGLPRERLSAAEISGSRALEEVPEVASRLRAIILGGTVLSALGFAIMQSDDPAAGLLGGVATILGLMSLQAGLVGVVVGWVLDDRDRRRGASSERR